MKYIFQILENFAFINTVISIYVMCVYIYTLLESFGYVEVKSLCLLSHVSWVLLPIQPVS